MAFKFRDPEGHPLELLRFPPDKGDRRWHGARDDGPVLGIDHSAIGIADTAASCRFYDGLLRLRLAGDGINSGLEQERLDGLPGVEVRITAHRCPEGAGLECLHYRQPTGGRPIPPDLSAQDGAHWQVRMRVNDLASIAAQAADWGGRLLSDWIVDLGEPPSWEKAAMYAVMALVLISCGGGALSLDNLLLPDLLAALF